MAIGRDSTTAVLGPRDQQVRQSETVLLPTNPLANLLQGAITEK